MGIIVLDYSMGIFNMGILYGVFFIQHMWGNDVESSLTTKGLKPSRGWSLTAGAVGGSWPGTQSITHTTKQTRMSYRLGKSIKHRLTRFRGFSVSYQIYNSPVLVFVV